MQSHSEVLRDKASLQDFTGDTSMARYHCLFLSFWSRVAPFSSVPGIPHSAPLAELSVFVLDIRPEWTAREVNKAVSMGTELKEAQRDTHMAHTYTNIHIHIHIHISTHVQLIHTHRSTLFLKTSLCITEWQSRVWTCAQAFTLAHLLLVGHFHTQSILILLITSSDIPSR